MRGIRGYVDSAFGVVVGLEEGDEAIERLIGAVALRLQRHDGALRGAEPHQG